SQLWTPRDLRYAPSTYWGLAVALDRSGELDAAMEAIGLARSYDPHDKSISPAGGSWFFSPEYDEAWYTALGHWAHARAATLRAARIESYLAAIRAWE